MYQMPNRVLSKPGLWYESIKLLIAYFYKMIPLVSTLSVIVVMYNHVFIASTLTLKYSNEINMKVFIHDVLIQMTSYFCVVTFVTISVGWLLRCMNDKKADIIKYLRSVQSCLPQILAMSLVYIVSVFVASWLLIPGIYLGISWAFFSVIYWGGENDLSLIKALQASRKLVKGYWWNTFLTLFVIAGINYLFLYSILLLFGVQLSDILINQHSSLLLIFALTTMSQMYWSSLLVLMCQQLKLKKKFFAQQPEAN
jgi:hypothetical protein